MTQPLIFSSVFEYMPNMNDIQLPENMLIFECSLNKNTNQLKTKHHVVIYYIVLYQNILIM